MARAIVWQPSKGHAVAYSEHNVSVVNKHVVNRVFGLLFGLTSLHEASGCTSAAAF